MLRIPLASSGDITMENHPFKDWVYEWDGAAHPEGEGDITSVSVPDGLDYSPVEVRQYKLNLVLRRCWLMYQRRKRSSNGKVMFQGTHQTPTKARLAAM